MLAKNLRVHNAAWLEYFPQTIISWLMVNINLTLPNSVNTTHEILPKRRAYMKEHEGGYDDLKPIVYH